MYENSNGVQLCSITASFESWDFPINQSINLKIYVHICMTDDACKHSMMNLTQLEPNFCRILRIFYNMYREPQNKLIDKNIYLINLSEWKTSELSSYLLEHHNDSYIIFGLCWFFSFQKSSLKASSGITTNKGNISWRFKCHILLDLQNTTGKSINKRNNGQIV